MEKVIDMLYKISSEMHSFLNGCGSFDEGHFWSRGKIYDNKAEAYEFFAPKPLIHKSYDEDGNLIGGWCEPRTVENQEELSMLDCRNDAVDMEMKVLIRERIYGYIQDFYAKSDNEDEFLLLLGFSINLYYIVGMYSVFGKFDIVPISCIVDSEAVKTYANLMNEFLYSRIVNGIVEGIQWLEFENGDLYNQTVDKILKNQEDTGIENLYQSVKKTDRNYIPDIYMLIKENDFEKESTEYLNKMIINYPDFKFGWIYRCLEQGILFYESKGNAIEVYEIKEKLGKDLFFHVLGFNSFRGQHVSSLDRGKWEWVNGKVERIRPAIFSEFGIGIPKIKTISKNDFYPIPNISENEVTRKTITYKDIRKQMEYMLGINRSVCIEENPLDYTGKLFDVVEVQKKELENKNAELMRLNNQRRNLIDHLAHSWGNECYPEVVKKVAEELLKRGNNSLANRLFKAYNSENNLMGEIIFLQSAMADEPEKLQNIFSDSFYISGEGSKEWKIGSVIEEAIEILTFSLLNYKGDNNKRNICRNKLCVKYTMQELTEDYSKRFENEVSSESFCDWFSKSVFPITVDIDDTWNKINFGNTEYGKIVIKNIFTELFANVLFHGDTSCTILLKSDNKKMYIVVRNNVSDILKGNEKGLTSMKEVIAKLNYNKSVSEDECVSYRMINDSVFETQITLAKDLMYKEEEW